MIIPHSQGGDLLRMTCKINPETQLRFMKLTQIQNPIGCCHLLKHPPLSDQGLGVRKWCKHSDNTLLHVFYFHFRHIAVKQTNGIWRLQHQCPCCCRRSPWRWVCCPVLRSSTTTMLPLEYTNRPATPRTGGQSAWTLATGVYWVNCRSVDARLCFINYIYVHAVEITHPCMHVHSNTHTHLHTCMYAHTHTHTHMHVHTHTGTCSHTTQHNTTHTHTNPAKMY